jgi:tetratricopeptide (TPR) repeat protein
VLALSSSDEAAVEEKLLDAGLPVEAAKQLRLAALAYQQDEVAERHLQAARAIAPQHAVVLIGLYRFYFYKGRLAEALAIAEVCLEKGPRDNGLAADWRAVRCGDADFGNYGARLPRFYLFTLKAYSYLQMRLGNTKEGLAAVMKLLDSIPAIRSAPRFFWRFWSEWDATMTNEEDIPEAIDWEGNPVNCAACPHRDLLAEGHCRLQHACVQDRYARRIDRFFDWNPDVANHSLEHPYFEVRAIAAKYADEMLLPWLLRDPDETVRWSAALRLPKRFLMRLIDDPHREVRIRVASRLEGSDLFLMMKDPDYYVRIVVAGRIAPSMLQNMMHDPDPEVRRVIAERIGSAWLMLMASDKHESVRLEAARRLPLERIIAMRHDCDWRVRYEVAGRIPPEKLSEMADDPDPLVRERVRSRLDSQMSTVKEQLK